MYLLWRVVARHRIGFHPARGCRSPEEKFQLVVLVDIDAVEKVMQGVDVVVQMAADPRPEASWESLLSSNIIGALGVPA